METEPGAAWTLVTSWSFKNKLFSNFRYFSNEQNKSKIVWLSLLLHSSLPPPHPPPPPFVVIWSRSVTSNENWKKTSIGWGYSCEAFFKAKTSHISDLNNCIKKRKGKEKRKHVWLFVCLTGSSKYCNFEQFCFLWQDNSLVNQRSCERKLP